MTTATLRTINAPPLRDKGQAPLSAHHLGQLDESRRRRKKIDRALVVAGFNAWTIAVFAALSLPLMLFDLKGGCVGIGLALIAYREFLGRHKLKQLEPRAPWHLGWNQVAMCGLLTLYCGWQIIGALTGPGQYADSIEATPELASTLEPIDELITMVTLAIYFTILTCGLIMQGSLSLYYFTRAKPLNDYLSQTPGWIIELQRRS